MKRRIWTAAWSISSVVLAVSVVGLGEPSQATAGFAPTDRRTPTSPHGTRSAFKPSVLPGCRRPRGTPIFAYVAIAVYAAVMAVEGGYEPFAVDIDAPGGASSEAAVAAAARRVLVHYLPGQAASIIEPAYESSLATIPDGQAEMDGVATGDAVATRLIELRAAEPLPPITRRAPTAASRFRQNHCEPRPATNATQMEEAMTRTAEDRSMASTR
jgi:hypothetical protein